MQQLVVILAVLGLCFAQNDTSVQFSSFDSASVANLQLNGVANSYNPNSENVLILTPSAGSQVGSAFLKTSITLTADASFSSAFSFKMDNPGYDGDEDGPGADGIVFIINSVTNNVGSQGGGMGYTGLGRSVGIEFDSYHNYPEDINGNHVGIDLNGNIVSVVAYPYPTRFNNGQYHYAWVDYNGNLSTIEVRCSDTESRPTLPLLTFSINLIAVLQTPNVYVGFSAATGGAWERHLIGAWTFTPEYAPIVTPGNPPAPTSVCGNGEVEDGEDCDGGDCCSTTCTFSDSTTVCRASAGSCDVAETCSGSSSSCPADSFASSTTVCRPAVDGCDIAESCTGSSASCPVDRLSMTGPCFCGRQNKTEPLPFPEYYCSPDGDLSVFYMCVYGVFQPQSAKMQCSAGTTCGCPDGHECSCGATQSPCVWANTLQQC